MILMMVGYLAYATYPQWSTFNGDGGGSPQSSITLLPNVVTTTNPTGAVVAGTAIDAAWVSQFMTDVNTARAQQGESPLASESSLDSFSGERFTTASSNYQISHYGFDSDMSCFFINCISLSELSGPDYVFSQGALDSVLNQGAYYQLPSGFSGSYWELNFLNSATPVYFTAESAISTYIHSTYGSYATVTFNSGGSFQVSFPQVGEVIFYPSQYTPGSYLSHVQTEAPLHWQVLDSSSFSKYGYFVGSGPVVSVNAGCPVSEIPGPNINVTQYFQGYGCQTSVTTDTWLVIDLTN